MYVSMYVCMYVYIHVTLNLMYVRTYVCMYARMYICMYIGTRDPRIGVGFIILSCMVQGTQYVFEEKVMTVEGLPPMLLVGLEVGR